MDADHKEPSTSWRELLNTLLRLFSRLRSLERLNQNAGVNGTAPITGHQQVPGYRPRWTGTGYYVYTVLHEDVALPDQPWPPSFWFGEHRCFLPLSSLQCTRNLTTPCPCDSSPGLPYQISVFQCFDTVTMPAEWHGVAPHSFMRVSIIFWLDGWVGVRLCVFVEALYYLALFPNIAGMLAASSISPPSSPSPNSFHVFLSCLSPLFRRVGFMINVLLCFWSLWLFDVTFITQRSWVRCTSFLIAELLSVWVPVIHLLGHWSEHLFLQSTCPILSWLGADAGMKGSSYPLCPLWHHARAVWHVHCAQRCGTYLGCFALKLYAVRWSAWYVIPEMCWQVLLSSSAFWFSKVACPPPVQNPHLLILVAEPLSSPWVLHPPTSTAPVKFRIVFRMSGTLPQYSDQRALPRPVPMLIGLSLWTQTNNQPSL